MASCHHFAEHGLNILRSLSKRWGVDLSPAEVLETQGRHAAATAAAAATTVPMTAAGGERWPRGKDPTTGPDAPFNFKYAEGSTRVESPSLNFFATTFTEDDLMGSGPSRIKSTCVREFGIEPEEQAEGSAAYKVEENPMFWPFPLQGRPMLPTGRELREAGFEML